MIIVLVSFIILSLLAIPIGYVMGISSMFGLINIGGIDFLRILITRLHSGLNSFILVSIPFFVLTAEFMNRSGITKRLINFVNNFIGHLPGGLSHVNIVVSIIFGTLTGSAVTDTVAVGGTLIPAMKKEGYSGSFSAAVTATSSVLGPIIPPSISMVIFSTMIRETTVRSLFAAGILPGLVIAGCLLVISGIQSYRRDYPRKKRASLKEILNGTKEAILPLLTPIIILGPILFGITEITEASAMGAFYALILGVCVYKTLKLKDIFQAAFSAAKVGGVIFLLLCTSQTLGWFISRSGISIWIADLLTTKIQSPILILAFLNIILLIVGMFVDTIPAVIILAPILAPPLIEIGFHPIHIAMIILVNLNIGNSTPPMGMTLMTASKIAQVPYEDAIKEAFPFIIAEIIACILITFIPIIPLWLPQVLGFI
ncbi:MAG: TRAP transporter large permease [Caldisericia bacterium]|nr:TRAP transporter large permease [Caldisericia bacterium]